MKLLNLILFGLLPIQISAQNTVSENVTKIKIEAAQLDTVKTIWVYLPKTYKTIEKSFPVIYMHDAQNLFDIKTSYSGEWEVDEFMDSQTDNQSIIVGIEHGNEKRIDELTPYKHKIHGGGHGNDYLNFIIDNLKPYIDKTYRTKPEAEFTSIFGSSLGGLISFYAVIKYPEIFGKAGVFSPAFWINPEIFDLVKDTEIPETSKFYFLAGTEEGETMLPKLEEMLELLDSKGLQASQIENHIINGGKHNEELWASHFGTAYKWLYN